MKTTETGRTFARSPSDPSHPGYQSLIASILNDVSNALQIPNDFLEPTCQRSSGSHSVLFTVASFKRYTIERQRAARKPWQPPGAEVNLPSLKEC